MPAKAIPIIVAAVVATGIVIYQNREQIVELYERGREKLAESLHKLADHVGPRQREQPHGYSDDNRRRSQSFDDRLRREEEAEGFLRPSRTTSHAQGMTTGRTQNAPARYRPRNIPPSAGESHVLYDLPAVDKELPPPPLPPRRTSEPEVEPTPSESGYGTEGTVISPPIRPTKAQQKSSPLAQQPELIMPSAPPAEATPPVPSPAAPVVPIAAAAVVAGAVAGTAAAATLTPEALASIPASSYTLPHVQSPPSIHSSSSHSEPDVIPPNPFESSASYMSTQEWINNTSSGSSDGGNSRPSTPAGSASDAGSVVSAGGEVVDIPDVVSDFGSGSEGEFDDAASWTELGSQTSENDY